MSGRLEAGAHLPKRAAEAAALLQTRADIVRHALDVKIT
jgi:hypothetical protein